MPFKTFWSSDLSVFPQKRKMHFKYAHSAKLVEVLINKFIFSVVSNPPHWSWHTMSSCYWQQSNANKTINQSHMLCLLYTFCERIAHFDFNVKTLSSSKKLVSSPSYSVALCCVCHFVSIDSRCSSTLIVLSLYYICAAIEENELFSFIAASSLICKGELGLPHSARCHLTSLECTRTSS